MPDQFPSKSGFINAIENLDINCFRAKQLSKYKKRKCNCCARRNDEIGAFFMKYF